MPDFWNGDNFLNLDITEEMQRFGVNFVFKKVPEYRMKGRKKDKEKYMQKM